MRQVRDLWGGTNHFPTCSGLVRFKYQVEPYKYDVDRNRKHHKEKRTKMPSNGRPCKENACFLLQIFHCLTLVKRGDGDDAMEDTQDAKDAEKAEQ